MITLVCGLGRCGTSLTMTMLKKGGLPVFADKLGSHEHSRMVTLPENSFWVQYADGHALKINDPHIYTPPLGLDYCAVWLTRNPNQQARSMMKLNTALGKREQGSRASYRKKVRWINRSEPKCHALLKTLTKNRVLHYTFEHIISEPAAYAKELTALIQLPVDLPTIEDMAACVEPRTSDSLKIPMELNYDPHNV